MGSRLTAWSGQMRPGSRMAPAGLRLARQNLITKVPRNQ
jgi:hypothetical protein